MTKNYSETVDTARVYYNSSDADMFYFNIWGGEDIHIGLYQNEGDSISEASTRTVERIASQIDGFAGKDSKVLDIGAGFGGSARFLAKKYGCHVTALNLSEIQNDRNRSMNKDQGLDDLIDVVDGSFEEIPFPDASFDVVWSQDAILHSGNREKVVREVGRVLKSGGSFVFTDPMQADDCPSGVLQPILDRIHLETLGSPGFYREAAGRCGMREIEFEDLTPHLSAHYDRVLKETRGQEDSLKKAVSETYIENMKKGLGHWIEGGKKGYLVWGIFHFRKA